MRYLVTGPSENRPAKSEVIMFMASSSSSLLLSIHRFTSSFPLHLRRPPSTTGSNCFYSNITHRSRIMTSVPDSCSVAAAEEKKNSESDVLVQYVVLRRDLIDTWPLGSVVTQGCHASVAAIWSNKDDPHTCLYCSPQNIDSMHKVTLEVKGETQIVNLSEKLKAAGIDHQLWVEQPENFPTCLATKPYPKSMVSTFFKKLKLCK